MKIFTLDKIIKFIIGELVGRFIGFCVALWCSKLFSHHTYEKKSIKNLFGLAKRKKIVVNEMPEWAQMLTIAIVGFIVMESINYLLEHPKVKSYTDAKIDQFLALFKKRNPISINSDINHTP